MLKRLQLSKLRQLRISGVWRKRLIIVLLILLLLTAAWYIANSAKDKKTDKQTQQVQSKIEELNQKRDNITCADILKELGNVSAKDIDKSDVKIDLLERQMQCYADQLDYAKAIQAGEQLKQMYVAKNDSANVERLTTDIARMKKAQKQLQEEQADD